MERRDVAAGNEGRAVAAQDDCAHRRVVARTLAGGAQRFDHAGVERVHDLRPVEGDGGDCAVHRVDQGFAHVRCSASKLTACVVW